MTHAFISYTTKDILTAEEVCAGLEQAGVECWMAPRDVSLLGAIEREIVDAIIRAQAFVLVFSSHTNESKKVLREVDLAMSEGVPIIPLRLDDAKPGLGFGYHLHGASWIDSAGFSPQVRLRLVLDAMSERTKLKLRPGEIPPKPILSPAASRAEPAAAPPKRTAASSPSKKIVLSYRRSDSSGVAGRLFDRLRDRFGAGAVYMDIDSIPFGTNFRAHIDGALGGCGVLLVIIGPKWLGKRFLFRARIFDADDPVRIEVETALRKGVPMIPVLLDGTAMPARSQLPEMMKEFSEFNAAQLSAGREFDTHAGWLLRAVEEMLASPVKSLPA